MKIAYAVLLLSALSSPALAAGYALHGTYLDYGPAAAALSVPKRVPAVLYVALHGRDAQLRLVADGAASCVPEFGVSNFVGRAHWGGPNDLAVHVEQKGDCARKSDDARLFLHFAAEVRRGVSTAILSDHVRGESGRELFEAN
jgi:hypothetical protein